METTKGQCSVCGRLFLFPVSKNAPVSPRVTGKLLSAFLLWANHSVPLTVAAANAHEATERWRTGPPCSSGGSAVRWKKQVFLQERHPEAMGWGPAGGGVLGTKGTHDRGVAAAADEGVGPRRTLLHRESSFIFTIKLVLKWLLKEYCKWAVFFFTLYISSSSLCTCHQVDSQCNKNRQLLLNQILVAWWVGPQNWHPGSSWLLWGGATLRQCRGPLPFIGGWKWVREWALTSNLYLRIVLFL